MKKKRRRARILQQAPLNHLTRDTQKNAIFEVFNSEA